MDCCQCQGIESLFDKRTAEKELKAYRKNGPDKTTRWLIDALRAEGVNGMTLLDIGGGVGAIQHELLRSGVSETTDADASSAYIAAAQEEGQRQGHAERMKFLYGNYVDLALKLAPTDIVTLDRVICCYHDMEALVGLSAASARKLYGVVYPRPTWWFRLGAPVINFVFRLRRNPFRIFLHPTEAVEAVIRSKGLERRFYRTSLVWQVAVYERTA